jgi:hypothetical protein
MDQPKEESTALNDWTLDVHDKEKQIAGVYRSELMYVGQSFPNEP